ncbi:MAG: citryl-CoA lyase [candidate division Zixibacteria bacterium]|nr:citryl-CoA lyase [candidate division Zixibacteria bacterium]
MAEYKWKTAITEIKKGEIRVRGYDIREMVGKLSFGSAVFLILKGELPTKEESEMMRAILVSSIDHGVTPPSVLSARTIISGGNPLNSAVAGGILTIGDVHGGAIERCARILQDRAKRPDEISSVAKELVSDFIYKRRRIPGFGHRLHETDPRTVKLFQIARDLNFSGKHMELAQAIEVELAKSLGKKLPINVDGAIAAVISDMGFDWRLGKGFFLISRVPGLVAHAYEELTRERPMRRLGDWNYEYDGPPERKMTDDE